MTTPTAGNWRINITIDGSAACVVESEDGRMICECYEDGEPHTGEDRANARLIAALPQLLNAARFALQEMRTTIAPRNTFTEAVDALDDAITKARQP